ncbi:MAG: ferrous iron transport protein A [Mycoplasmataceae bacterium]|jgi:Fe2+ transport system protein FeoA|nr:ferrous iron transport protein A [Mycoplasmataceae bacterium]
MQLSHELKGKTLVVTGINFKNQHVMHKISNIGITKDTIIKVLNYDKNNIILHLLVYGVEYVLREKDCRYISVREYKDSKQFQIKR